MTWRLILDGSCDGAWNMAVDRAMQLGRESGEAPPTLRLYGWSQPTLTLGRFQDVAGFDLMACKRAGIAVVRRATGGRGVLHDDEVTYCIVASAEDGVPRGTFASYRHFGAGVVETLRELGVEAQVSGRSPGTPDAAACYLHTTQADIAAGSSKLSGSAQVWHGNTCMQHGSFMRTRDMDRAREIFHLSEEEADILRARTVTLADLCDVAPVYDEIIDAATVGFSRALGVSLEPGSLSDAEFEVAQSLLDGEVADPI